VGTYEALQSVHGCQAASHHIRYLRHESFIHLPPTQPHRGVRGGRRREQSLGGRTADGGKSTLGARLVIDVSAG
jgi:hypothetical protein